MRFLKFIMGVLAAYSAWCAYHLVFMTREMSGVNVVLFRPDAQPGAAAILLLCVVAIIAFIREMPNEMR